MEDNKKKKKINKTDKADFQNKYKRALADYHNLAKQQAKEQADFVKYANTSLLEDLLPVYSYLKMSLDHAGKENNSWLEGVKHVAKQFKSVLEARGVKEILTVNQVFDPETMEAIEEKIIDDESLDGLVAKELVAGYTLHDRTIMPAKVAVYKYNNN